MDRVHTVTDISGDGRKEKIMLTELWGGIRDGKKASLEKLYALFYSQLFNYGVKLVKRDDLVKDCIQELFLTLWEKRFSIRQANSVKSYLYYSFRRVLFRRLKREKNRLKRNWIFIEINPDESKNIEDLIVVLELKKEEKQKIRSLVHTLSDRQREALELKYYEGLTNDEIASLMSINKQSVYNHISQAIATLQSLVKN